MMKLRGLWFLLYTGIFLYYTYLAISGDMTNKDCAVWVLSFIGSNHHER
jgi:hypothetical protein